MHARYAALFFIIIAITMSTYPVHATTDHVGIIFSRFLMQTIPGVRANTYESALKMGDSPQIQTCVDSEITKPTVLIDASQLDATVLLLSSRSSPSEMDYNGVHYYSVYCFNHLITVGANVPDGLKTVTVSAADPMGNAATGTLQITFDNTPPTISLTDISFSTTSPKKGDTMYLSGTADGTGSPLTVYNIWETIWDAKGNNVYGAGFGNSYYGTALTSAIATSTDDTFTRVPYTIIDTPENDLANAATMNIAITAYDGSGHIVTTSLTVPVPKAPPPDPCAVPGVCSSNVLFLPGIEASRLYEDVPCSNGTCETKLWEPGGDTLASRLAHDATGASISAGIYVKKNGVIDNAYIPINGNIYKSFIEQMNGLVTAGTVKEWEAIPYDWRLTPDQILGNGAEIAPGKISYLVATSSPYIIQELKRLAATSKTHKVTIIAHSNGGLLTKALTEKLGADASKYIDKIVFVAVPQAGAPQAVGALLHGYDQGLPSSFISFGLSDGAARTLATNMPMTYNLLPSKTYFTQVDTPVVTFTDQPILADFRTRYGSLIHSSELLHTFITDSWRVASSTTEGLNYPSVGNASLLTNAEVLHDTNLDIWMPPTGITLYEVAGWGEKTLAGIDYYQGIATHCDQFSGTLSRCTKTPKIDYKPRIVLDGDGTVPTPSALWTPNAKRYWVDLGKYNNQHTFSAPLGRQHADILEVGELRTFLQNIITNNDSANLPQYVSTSTPINPNPNTELHFTLHSPLTLNLYDDQGRHTGISTTTGELEENIPESSYMKFGEVQFISAPTSLNTHLVMSGYEAGSFTLDAEEVNGETIVASTTFAGIPSDMGTVAAIDAPSGGLMNIGALMVDENGDGYMDITLQPKAGNTVIFDIIPPEIQITFSTTTKSVAFIGTDDSGTATIATSTTYTAPKNNKKEKEKDREKENRGLATTSVTARDEAGNTAVLTYTNSSLESEKRDTATLVSLGYNEMTNNLTTTTFQYKWSTNKKGEYTMFAAYLKTASSTIEAHYQPKKNVTTIMTKPQELDDREDDEGEDSRPVRTKLPGLVIPALQTEKGSVKIVY